MSAVDEGADAPRTGLAAMARHWRRFTRVASGVVGADRYERYLAWHRNTGQTGDPMDVKAFWRHEMDRQERNPSSRCC